MREGRIIQHAPSAEEAKLLSLFNSLDPLSITQHLAFYELYPKTDLGDKALRRAWTLLNGGKEVDGKENLPYPKFDLQAIISLVTRQSFDPPAELSDAQISLIEKLGESLHNRKLKGHTVWKEEELTPLGSDEIDLARALLLSQFADAKDPLFSIRQYEANLDLMALQIRARLPSHATADQKIREINRFIFQEMQFRFPPHSLYAKDIDLYTFLPSVLDSRQGVCLGVSILYLTLAQRLDLPLEIITPPGHIFLRCETTETPLNIETTARGIHLPDETYLGINTRKLERRSLREVIGLAFLNQASVFWGKEDYTTTVTLYEKALIFLPDDLLLKTFLGLNYLFVGKKAQGKELLKQVQHVTFDHEVSHDTIADDYLNGKVDAEGIKVIFLPVDENRASILEKQKKIQKVLARYPRFRAGLLQLATSWLQLGRGSEALSILEKYHSIDPTSSIVEYYLSLVSLQRMDFLQAWEFLHTTEKITNARNHHPKALKGLRNQLKRQCPEPT
ncbi:MAG: transglutaminase family protein [Chlamydiales bacterium]